MKNEFLDRGIITPSGEISKAKINLVTGAVTPPFAEMVWILQQAVQLNVRTTGNIYLTVVFDTKPFVHRLVRSAAKSRIYSTFKGCASSRMSPHRANLSNYCYNCDVNSEPPFSGFCGIIKMFLTPTHLPNPASQTHQV